MKRIQSVFKTLSLIVILAFCVPAYAQLGALKNAVTGKEKDNKDSKDSKDSKDNKGKDAAKTPEATLDEKSPEEFYLDMKDFAEGLYNKPVGEGDKRRDSDFKRRVDTEFESLKRLQADHAYKVNLSAHSEVRYVKEDRFRVFSGLYDNLLVQDLLNRTGQSIIPKTSDRLYTFKLIADPVPRADTLSTGTIYVTTGLIALLNTKAQLAYVLAHEAAHVHRGHFKTEIMINLAAEEYAAKAQANKEAVQKKLALFGAIAGGIAGGIVGNSRDNVGAGVVLGGMAGAMIGAAIGGRDAGPVIADWNSVQENEADQTAFEWLLSANLNVDEIPKVYVALKDAGDHDDRVTLGFLGRANRVRERSRKVDEWLGLEKAKPDFSKRVFQSSDPDFDILMAEVKRDNGIMAFQYDMLDIARDNLEKAVAIKTADPTALYFYAKVLQETARTDEERAKALEYYKRAADNDSRNLNFGAKLHRAVALLKPDATNAEKQEAVALLKGYLEGYYLSAIRAKAQEDEAAYPPHLDTIYDYLSRLGEFKYVLDGDKVRRENIQMEGVAKTVGQVEVTDNTQPRPAQPAATPARTTPATAPAAPRTPAR